MTKWWQFKNKIVLNFTFKFKTPELFEIWDHKGYNFQYILITVVNGCFYFRPQTCGNSTVSVVNFRLSHSGVLTSDHVTWPHKHQFGFIPEMLRDKAKWTNQWDQMQLTMGINFKNVKFFKNFKKYNFLHFLQKR